MASTIKFVFSKCFFAEYLCVSVDRVSFAVMRYVDEEVLVERPAIKVKGIDRWFFDIETLNFIRLSANHTLIPAKIKKHRDLVIFSTNDGAEIKYDLDNFHRYYMRRVVSSLIKDAPSTSKVPTIRKNKWEEEHRVLLLKFNKRFWSKLLHISPHEITYGFIKANYYMDDELAILENTDLVPVLKIKGISGYYFSIENGRFFKPEEHNVEFNYKYWGEILLTEYVPAKIVCSKDKVVFSAKNGENSVLYLWDIFRHYMSRVVNTLIL